MLTHTRIGLPVSRETAIASSYVRWNLIRHGFFQSSAVGAGHICWVVTPGGRPSGDFGSVRTLGEAEPCAGSCAVACGGGRTTAMASTARTNEIGFVIMPAPAEGGAPHGSARRRSGQAELLWRSRRVCEVTPARKWTPPSRRGIVLFRVEPSASDFARISRMTDVRAIADRLQQQSSFLKDVVHELDGVIVGQKPLLEGMLLGLLADGHVLLEGVPGLAKTLAVQSLATALGGSFRRIQFTPDLLPSDLLGTQVYNP